MCSHDVTVVDDNYSIIKQQYEYSLKAVNPSRMSQYKTIKINECPQECLKSMDKLRDFMAKNIPSTCNEDIGAVEMGYIEPGHGSKGKKVWLCNEKQCVKYRASTLRKGVVERLI